MTDTATSSVPLLHHGAIGNGRVLALVAPSTHIEWLCLPRFDSPSVFGALLDSQKGGSFGFESAGGPAATAMAYVPNTNVLRTRMTIADAVLDIFDYAPRQPAGLSVDAPLEIHRVIVPIAGTARLRIIIDPKPDYGRAAINLVPQANGIDIESAAGHLHLRTNLPVPQILNGTPVLIDQPSFLILSWGRPTDITSAPAAQHALDMTIAGWRAWAKACSLPPFAPAAVLRSALCLKLHAFEDSGAIIAAATTSIPEALGTERTWDYRYCWLRDAAFVVEALRRLGHLSEGEAFVRFLRDVAEDGPLQPIYGIGGERVLTEEILDHLAGFAGTKPVRIGNAAYSQSQHDVMGEMVLCLDMLMSDLRIVTPDQDRLMDLVSGLVEQAIAASSTTDTGLWEYRTAPRFHTFSQVLCWVAAHRGARLARDRGLTTEADRWDCWAEAQRTRVLSEAFNQEKGFFTQVLNGDFPDASNLLLPTLGIIDARDARFVSTVRAYETLLVERGLMLRYRQRDDFGYPTSAFSICSFWWVEALAMMGELDRAAELFETLVSYANPLGLFSEDIEPGTGRLLGNFPQAYTHVGLIHAAITIGELQEARDGRFRAWT